MALISRRRSPIADAVAARRAALPIAAQKPRQCRGQWYERNGGNRARKAQQPEIFAEKLCRGGQERHQRRYVGIAEIGVASANDEIKLVAVEIVAPGCEKVRDRHDRRN